MLKMSKLFIVAVVVLAAITYFYNMNDKNSKIVRIGHMNIATSLMLFVAEEKGWFKDAGIEYEEVIIPVPDQMVNQLFGGHIDIYINSTVISFFAASSVSPDKAKIILLHPWYKKNPFDAIIVRKDADINVLKDIEGKKIGIYPGDILRKTLIKAFEINNIDISKVELIPIAPSMHVQALLSGRIDALHTVEPMVSVSMDNDDMKYLYDSPIADIMNPVPIGHGAISNDFLKSDPDTAKKVVEIFMRALLYIENNESEVREILSTRLGLNEKISKSINMIPTEGFEDINSDKLQAYADFMIEIGVVSVKMDVDDYIYDGE